MKHYTIILILFILFSCNNYNEIVVLDNYFIDMFSIDINNFDSELVVIEPQDFNFDNISNYERIIITPLLFNYYNEQFVKMQNEIVVLGENVDNKNYNVIFAELDYTKAYLELIEKLDIYNSNVRILIDYEKENKKKDVEILKNISKNNDIDFMFLNNNISRSDINNYINENSQCDLWIIDSREYGLYIYDLLKDKKIILIESGHLSEINDNIIFSIDYDMEQSIFDIVHEKSKTIELKLKKH